MSETAWRACKLGDLIEIKHGFAFLGEHFAREGTHVVLTPGNFFDEGGFKHKGENEKWYRGPIPPEYVLSEGDLIVAMTEQAEGLLGSAAIVPLGGRYLHNQRLGLVRLRDPDAIDVGFVYRLFNSRPVRQQIRASASGTKIRHTSPSRLSEVRVRVPPLAVQRRIAGILSAYDGMIENCQRRIKLLDSMARALYREWFVYFRYPGHESAPLVSSPLGEIPQGWEVKRLGELALELRCSVAKGSLPEPQRLVELEHIPRRSLALDAWDVTSRIGSNKLQFRKGDILFGKIRPYFHKVCVAPFDGLCSADTIVLGARRPEHHAVVLCCVSSDEMVALASATSNGSKMPRASWGVMAEHLIALPPSTVAERFSKTVGAMIHQMQTLVFQAQSIRRTRELLVPYLLSPHSIF